MISQTSQYVMGGPFTALHRAVRCSVIAFALLSTAPLQRAHAQESARPVRATAPVPARARPNAQIKPRRPVVDKLQQRVDNVLRNRLQLTDDQFSKLRAMNARLDEERVGIRQEENATRRELRQELLPGANTNDAHVSELLDKLPQIERKRIALQEREQKELAGFLQPTQRARYFALQDEIRRSLQDVQRLRKVPGDTAAGVLRGAGRTIGAAELIDDFGFGTRDGAV